MYSYQTYKWRYFYIWTSIICENLFAGDVQQKLIKGQSNGESLRHKKQKIPLIFKKKKVPIKARMTKAPSKTELFFGRVLSQ